ncbi:MAG: amidohydrolase family protein [Verrucomicrobiae bacterium]|nr:amidohydrolase family protein [Verrucomicrobiae bacterium]
MLLLTSLVATAAEPLLEPPGFRPRPLSLHALVGARMVTEPGIVLTNHTLILRDGIIQAIEPGDVRPAGARIWDLEGNTIYPAFIEPYLVPGARRSPPPREEFDADAGWDARSSDGAGGPRFFGVAGQERDPGHPGPGATSPHITPEHRMATTTGPESRTTESLRELGFAAAQLVPAEGILRGQAALFMLGDSSPNLSLVRADTAQCIALSVPSSPGGGRDRYPGSLMGVLSLWRQTFLDAAHRAADIEHYAHHPGQRPRPAFNTALDALQAVAAGQPVLIEANSVLMTHRAARLADELGLHHRAFVATGEEWRRPDLARTAGGPFIVPLTFPALPRFPSDSEWEDVSLDQLRAWDWAPENPALLRREGLDLAVTTHGLSDLKSFRRQLRAALDRGWNQDDALAALTVVPARLAGVSDRLGTLAPGRIANLTIVTGSYFDPEKPIHSVWIDGVPHLPPPALPKSPATARSTDPDKPSPDKAKPDDPKPDTAAKDAPPADSPKDEESRRQPRVARSPLDGRGPITSPRELLIRGATIWTSGPAGILTNAHLLVRDGRIAAVGHRPITPSVGVVEIDASGLHLTPGLIDCHSHSMILGSVNEGTLPSTAMVRIGDVVNSESAQIRYQLAGGLTIANLLHGSANPIGGQNRVIKLRDGAAPDDLAFRNAPEGIKFALGENVKQSNWGERHTTRFPQTRMGVQTFYANRFTAAQHYRAQLRAAAAPEPGAPPPPPVRRDLELEALAEILDGTRLIHCHSYRQDEIVAFLRTMESFGIRVATLQHILEGYKVADEIARHGAGASAFSDWWAFKVEVIDAIPYAGSIMRERGVNVSFNSDSNDQARRLNLEAAKAVKYGRTPPADALRFVTLHPAQQLGIDRWVGSLEVGKDADFVLWSGHPLDSASVCLETWIDGRKYFDRAQEAARVRALADERDALLAKARSQSSPASRTGTSASDAARALFFRRALEQATHLGVRDCQDCLLPNHP